MSPEDYFFAGGSSSELGPMGGSTYESVFSDMPFMLLPEAKNSFQEMFMSLYNCRKVCLGLHRGPGSELIVPSDEEAFVEILTGLVSSRRGGKELPPVLPVRPVHRVLVEQLEEEPEKPEKQEENNQEEPEEPEEMDDDSDTVVNGSKSKGKSKAKVQQVVDEAVRKPRGRPKGKSNKDLDEAVPKPRPRGRPRKSTSTSFKAKITKKTKKRKSEVCQLLEVWTDCGVEGKRRRIPRVF